MKIEVCRIGLTPYDEETHCRILLPQGYDSGIKRYPVVYLNDGQWIFGGEYSVVDSFSNGDSLEFASYYQDYCKTLPEVILVGIDGRAIGTDRTNAFGPPTNKTVIRNDSGLPVTYQGSGNRYAEWIVRELKPYIDGKYRTRPEGRWTAIGGFSSGGSSALYTQLTYPEVFSRVLMFGSAVWLWDCWFTAALAGSAANVRIQYLYMLCGTDEVTVVGNKEWTLAGNRAVFERLIACGVQPDKARFYEIKGGYHALSEWRPFFPDSLRWVFQDLC